jgi:hypothetical protein
MTDDQVLELFETTPASTADMAKLLGISPRRLQQLSKGGWIDGRVAHGKYLRGVTLRSYVTHLQLCKARGSDPSYED